MPSSARDELLVGALPLRLAPTPFSGSNGVQSSLVDVRSMTTPEHERVAFAPEQSLALADQTAEIGRRDSEQLCDLPLLEWHMHSDLIRDHSILWVAAVERVEESQEPFARGERAQVTDPASLEVELFAVLLMELPRKLGNRSNEIPETFGHDPGDVALR